MLAVCLCSNYRNCKLKAALLCSSLSQKLRALLLYYYTTSNKEAHIQRACYACVVLLLRKKHGGHRAAISEAAEDRGRRGQQQPPPSSTTTSRPRRNCEHSRKDHDDKLNSSRVCCCYMAQPTALSRLRPPRCRHPPSASRRVLNGMHHEVISLQMAKVWHPHTPFPEMTMVFQVLLFGLAL